MAAFCPEPLREFVSHLPVWTQVFIAQLFNVCLSCGQRLSVGLARSEAY